MSNLNGIINVARSSIFASQTAIRIASQNITNAETEGYSRQRVTMVDSRPDVTPYGRLGTGVRVYDIDRVRDELLDVSYRRESGRSSSFELRHELMSQVEQVLGEPSDTGLAASLDAYYASWADLSNQPLNDTAKRVVIQRSEHLAATLNGFTGRLDELVQSTRTRLNKTVEDVNRLTAEIAKVNEIVVREESGGQNATDLRDQRDRLIDSLAKLASVRTIDRGNGSVAVMVEGSLVVDGNSSRPLSANGEPPVIRAGASNLVLASEGSSIGEMVSFLNTRLPGVQRRLDDLAGAIVVQTNALHTTGHLPTGPGGNFFDPAGTTARNIRVVATAATVVTSNDGSQPNNNRIALAIANMRNRASQNELALPAWTPAQAGMLGGVSASEHYRTTIADLAVQTRVAEDSSTVFGTLADQLETRRKSVSGVSTDEEMIRVMQHQQAYAAAARLVNVVDEMFQTVLDMKR